MAKMVDIDGFFQLAVHQRQQNIWAQHRTFLQAEDVSNCALKRRCAKSQPRQKTGRSACDFVMPCFTPFSEELVDWAVLGLYLERTCLSCFGFLTVNPPKECTFSPMFHSKQGSLKFQAYMYIYIYYKYTVIAFHVGHLKLVNKSTATSLKTGPSLKPQSIPFCIIPGPV